MEVLWQAIADPSAYALAILGEEASDIPVGLVTSHEWFQDSLDLATLDVNREIIARHDADSVHLARRDGFVGRILDGESIPPLIVLGTTLHLVDGYARWRALRALRIARASVLRQKM